MNSLNCTGSSGIWEQLMDAVNYKELYYVCYTLFCTPSFQDDTTSLMFFFS